MRLCEATKKILGKELPWLIPLLPENAQSFRVEVIDTDVLAMIPWGYQSSSVEWIKYGPIYFVDNEGHTLGEVGTYAVQVGTNGRHTFHWGWPLVRWVETPYMRTEPETVEQALTRLGSLADGVRYVVAIKEKGEVVLHRLPKPRDIIFKAWMEQKLLEERIKLQKQLKRLDAGM